MAKTIWLKKFNDDCERVRETIYDEGVVKKMKKHINEELMDLIQESTKALAKDIEKLRGQITAIESSLDKIEATGEKPSGGANGAETVSDQSKKFNRLLSASSISMDSESIVVVPVVGLQPRKTSYLKAKSQKPKIEYQIATS
jgi:hypothetical protein